MNNTFQKQEKITGRDEISTLFDTGNWIEKGMIRAVYLLHKKEVSDYRPKILISAPKKTIRKAVQRNRIKRQIREAYRLNNSRLKAKIAEKHQLLNLGFIYIGNPDPEYRKIESAVKKILNFLETKL